MGTGRAARFFDQKVFCGVAGPPRQDATINGCLKQVLHFRMPLAGVFVARMCALLANEDRVLLGRNPIFQRNGDPRRLARAKPDLDVHLLSGISEGRIRGGAITSMRTSFEKPDLFHRADLVRCRPAAKVRGGASL